MSAPLVVLPKLPGLVYDTPQAAKKTQSLKFVNGYAVVSQDASVSSAAGGVGIGLRDGLVGSGLPASLLSPPAPAPLPASEPSCSQPRWLVHDKKARRGPGSSFAGRALSFD